MISTMHAIWGSAGVDAPEYDDCAPGQSTSVGVTVNSDAALPISSFKSKGDGIFGNQSIDAVLFGEEESEEEEEGGEGEHSEAEGEVEKPPSSMQPPGTALSASEVARISKVHDQVRLRDKYDSELLLHPKVVCNVCKQEREALSAFDNHVCKARVAISTSSPAPAVSSMSETVWQKNMEEFGVYIANGAPSVRTDEDAFLNVEKGGGGHGSHGSRGRKGHKKDKHPHHHKKEQQTNQSEDQGTGTGTGTGSSASVKVRGHTLTITADQTGSPLSTDFRTFVAAGAPAPAKETPDSSSQKRVATATKETVKPSLQKAMDAYVRTLAQKAKKAGSVESPLSTMTTTTTTGAEGAVFKHNDFVRAVREGKEFNSSFKTLDGTVVKVFGEKTAPLMYSVSMAIGADSKAVNVVNFHATAESAVPTHTVVSSMIDLLRENSCSNEAITPVMKAVAQLVAPAK